MFLRAIKLFNGHPASKTIKPENALRPSSLHESNKNWEFYFGIYGPTDWYKNRPPISISKGAAKEDGCDFANSEKPNYIYLRR